MGSAPPDGTNTSVAATTEAVIVTANSTRGRGWRSARWTNGACRTSAPAEPRATNSAVRPMPKPLRVAYTAATPRSAELAIAVANAATVPSGATATRSRKAMGTPRTAAGGSVASSQTGTSATRVTPLATRNGPAPPTPVAR